MIGRCPACGRTLPEDPSAACLPFCSPRCRLRDLGAWLDGRHAIPGPPLDGDGGADAAAGP